MFFVNTIVVQITLLNLLIAVVSDTYNEFMRRKEEHNLRLLCYLILDIEYLFSINYDEFEYIGTGINRVRKIK